MMTRQEKILACIDPETQLGLEIGALNRPIVTRELGNIRYVDHASTEDLKQKYANDPNVDIEAIVDVDYIWGAQTLPELVGQDAPFDYVIASHVIEHVPDLIGWLKEIHAVLKPGGILTLAIPDKRCCFDFYRPLTQAPAAIEAYVQKRRKPSPGQIFEFYSFVAYWNGQFVWEESAVGREDEVVRLHSVDQAWQTTKQATTSEDYYDVHCWVFTPTSFFALLKTLIQAGLFDFQVVQFYGTTGCEFYVSLAAMDLTKDSADRQAIQLESLPLMDEQAVGTVESADFHALKAELHQEQTNAADLQSRLQKVRGEKQRLKTRVTRLQNRLQELEVEVAAIQSSRLWMLREQWARVRQVFGFKSFP